MNTPYTKELVGYLSSLQYPDIGPDVFERARYLLLDYLGVAIRGSRAESSEPVYKMIERIGAPGPCTVIGTNLRTLPGDAALANGTAAHAIELDDTHNAGSIHLGVVMFSAALALSEALPNVTASDFFIAVVAGYEAAARIAMAVQPKEHYLLGFHPTATCGVFGSAVTASKLLGLNEEQMVSAVGIAGSMAAGSLEFLAEGAWTKRLHPGLAAQNGIHAAMLAAEGFRGPSTILEGRDGFLNAYSRKPLPELLTQDLGESFEIMHTAVKPHACCRYMQGPIDAILALVREHDIQPDQVASIDTAVLEAGWPLVVEPREQKYQPKSVVEAQFSMPFGAAVAVLNRSAGIDQFTEESIQSPDVRRMMAKVVMTKHATIEKNFPQEWAAIVTIKLTDGRTYEKHITHPKGDPQNPLTRDELIAKFKSLAGNRDDIVTEVLSGNVPAKYASVAMETSAHLL
ncbi:MAG TPA: MmgE/PrpD family protein [Bryobacteraceae bacterium]|nr:MmgE/PrpD family protein [Bryobacteraceae bacterium]